jgi:hypothetical protein
VVGFLLFSVTAIVVAVVSNNFDVRQQAQVYCAGQNQCVSGSNGCCAGLVQVSDPSCGTQPVRCVLATPTPVPMYARCKNNLCSVTSDPSGKACVSHEDCITPTLTPVPPAPTPRRYSCQSNGSCVEAANGNFTSLQLCQAECVPATSTPRTSQTPTPAVGGVGEACANYGPGAACVPSNWTCNVSIAESCPSGYRCGQNCRPPATPAPKSCEEIRNATECAYTPSCEWLQEQCFPKNSIPSFTLGTCTSPCPKNSTCFCPSGCQEPYIVLGDGFLTCGVKPTVSAVPTVSKVPIIPTSTVAKPSVGTCYFGARFCSELGREDASGCLNCPSQAGVCCGAIKTPVTQVCIPDTSSCANNTVRMCKADGTGWIDQVCGAGLVCDGYRCVSNIAVGASCSQGHDTLIRDNAYCCNGKVQNGHCSMAIQSPIGETLADQSWCNWGSLAAVVDVKMVSPTVLQTIKTAAANHLQPPPPPSLRSYPGQHATKPVVATVHQRVNRYHLGQFVHPPHLNQGHASPTHSLALPLADMNPMTVPPTPAQSIEGYVVEI